MSGLNISNKDNWDSENLGRQLSIVITNIRELKDYLDSSTETGNTLLRRILTQISGRQAKLEISNPKEIFELQKDLAVLLILCDNGFDFQRYSGDTRDFYTIAQEFIRQTGTCTDIAMQFPQMVQDAITAIETDGKKPPAAEMQEAKDYFASRIIVAIGESESQTLSTDEEQYFKAVDDARKRVDTKLGRNNTERNLVHDLDIQIDDIMKSQDSFAEKIRQLRLIAQN